MKQSNKEIIMREMKRLSVGGGLIGEAAILALSSKKIYKEPFGCDYKKRSFEDGEIIELKSPAQTNNNVCFEIGNNREIWLSQIQGLYFTIRQDGNNECDFPTFIMKNGQEIKLEPFCDINSFVEFVKDKKFKIEQKKDYHIKVSFSGTSKNDCLEAHKMVWDENGNFMGLNNLIAYCLEKLNSNNYNLLQNGYFVNDKLYYLYEV